MSFIPLEVIAKVKEINADLFSNLLKNQKIFNFPIQVDVLKQKVKMGSITDQPWSSLLQS